MLKYKIPQVFTLIRFYVDPDCPLTSIATKSLCNFYSRGFCDRDRIQTCNRLIRSQLLYSVELRDLDYFMKICDRDRIQTCNRLIRSQLLYSVELRGPH